MSKRILITGDIRHCFADIAKAKRLLGYDPQVHLEEGLTELADWLGGQIAIDRVEQGMSRLCQWLLDHAPSGVLQAME